MIVSEGLIEVGGITMTEMQHLNLQVRLPDGHWAGDATRENHHITLRIDEHMPLPNGRGTAHAHAFGQDIDRFLESVRSHEGVDEIQYHDKNEDAVGLSLTIGKSGGGFLRPLMKAAAIPRTPFEVRDGWVDWEFAMDQSHAKMFIDALRGADIPHRILSFSRTEQPRLLTKRQREVFDAAVALGYYETPRRITLTELAAHMGVSKSTLCGIVHLIEKHIIDEFAERVRQQSPQESTE